MPLLKITRAGEKVRVTKVKDGTSCLFSNVIPSHLDAFKPAIIPNLYASVRFTFVEFSKINIHGSFNISVY